MLLPFPYRGSVAGREGDRIKHPEQALVGIQVASAQPSDCIRRISISNLIIGPEYTLGVQYKSQGGVRTDKNVVLLDKRRFTVSANVTGSVSQAVLLQMPVGRSGITQDVVSIFLFDAFPKLSEDDALLSTRTVRIDRLDTLACPSEAMIPPDAVGAIVVAWTFLRSDDKGAITLFTPITFRGPYSIRRVASVTALTIQSVSCAPGPRSDGNVKACRRKNFFSTSSSNFADIEADKFGQTKLVKTKLPLRRWEAGSYEVTMDIHIDEESFRRVVVMSSQVVHVEQPNNSFFQQERSSWCDALSGLDMRSVTGSERTGTAESTTIVAGFWSPNTMHVKKRGEEAYWPWIENLWSVQAPVILYTSANMVSELLGMGDWAAGPRCIRVLNISDFFVNTLKEPLQQMVDRDAESFRYSVEYSMIMHEKVHLLSNAASRNLFSTDYFLWLDAGISIWLWLWLWLWLCLCASVSVSVSVCLSVFLSFSLSLSI